MNNKVRIGVIGAGRVGKLHARNITYRISGAEVGAISDIRKEAIEKVGISDAQDFDAYEDYKSMLEDPEIDGIVITSPTPTHTRIIEDAAEAGKDIFCEKPIALDLGKTEKALKSVDERGVKLQVGFMRRFDPSFRRAKKRVQEGDIGDPHILRITSRDPEPPSKEYLKDSGGLFIDSAIHDFDMARYLVDDRVIEVYATGSVMVDEEIEKLGDVDTALTILRFEGGTLGAIDNSRKAVYGYDQRIEVFGSEGKISVPNKPKNGAVLADSKGIHRPLLKHFFSQRYEQAFIEEIREFINCIKKDQQPLVDGEDGRMAVVLAYAADRSREENQPVKVSEIEQRSGL